MFERLSLKKPHPIPVFFIDRPSEPIRYAGQIHALRHAEGASRSSGSNRRIISTCATRVRMRLSWRAMSAWVATASESSSCRQASALRCVLATGGVRVSRDGLGSSGGLGVYRGVGTPETTRSAGPWRVRTPILPFSKRDFDNYPAVPNIQRQLEFPVSPAPEALSAETTMPALQRVDPLCCSATHVQTSPRDLAASARCGRVHTGRAAAPNRGTCGPF